MRLKNSPPRICSRSVVSLAALLFLGTVLRFWHLDLKPLWLDEVLTALFGLGRSFRDIPLNQFFPLSTLETIFAYQPGVSCSQIAQTVATESVHPPLFFCLVYQWIGWLRPSSTQWVWALRALPAGLGVGTIAAIYALNRTAFSRQAGWLAAALMAISPFAVYLSQEARHYTLPMLLITLALWGLVQIQRDLMQPDRLRPLIWLGWAGINLLSLYIHYFCILALVAQIGALLIWLIWQRHSLTQRALSLMGLTLSGIALGYLPWLPTVISHFRRPETNWLIPYNPDWLDRLAPLYQTLVGWTLMFIALPVEKQPQPIAIGSAVLMISFIIWLSWRVGTGFRQLWHRSSLTPLPQTDEQPATYLPASTHLRASIVLLLSFTLGVMAEFLAIAYLLNKDLTVVPRYNFVYYPGLCALVGACLIEQTGATQANRAKQLGASAAIVLLAGLLSSLLVVNGWVFLKSYTPDRVAKNLSIQPNTPLAVVVAYDSLQEVALGLSFALELRRYFPEPTGSALAQFAFVDKAAGYRQTWKILAEMPQPLPLPLNLWVIASPGMRTEDYPDQLRLSYSINSQRQKKVKCAIDPKYYHRVGFPYQLFRCLPN